MKNPETVFCEQCKKNVSYHYTPVNHVKQLLLSIFTLGIWLPIWLGMVYCPTKICDECNGSIWAGK